MIKEIKLPEIADNVDNATVLNISVSEGDKISKDDTLAEMESDKAAFDLPADFGGTIKEVKVSEGDEVDVGQVMFTVETEEEDGDEKEKEEKETGDEGEQPESREAEEEEADKEPKKEKGEKKDEEKEKEKAEEESKEKKEAKEKHDKADQDKKEKQEKTEDKGKETEKEADKEKPSRDEKKKPDKEVPASPSVRRLAREIGVDIYRVEGTGPYNRITPEDVKAYAKDLLQKASGKQLGYDDEYQLPDFSKYGEIERKPLDSIRKRTAINMTASWQNIPHVFQFDKADVTGLEAFRKKYGKQVEKEGAKLTVTAIAIKIMAKALETFPKFNASLDPDNEEVIYKKYYNIGVAVDTERGLLVPVIRNVDRKSIVNLSKELGEMAEKARNKKIKPDELQGANIAISNLGGIGGTNFTPIVYRPNVAILGMSRTTTEPVYIDGEFKPRLMLPLSLSYDHRLIDGAEAARFLRWYCEALENPLLTLFKGGE